MCLFADNQPGCFFFLFFFFSTQALTKEIVAKCCQVKQRCNADALLSGRASVLAAHCSSNQPQQWLTLWQRGTLKGNRRKKVWGPWLAYGWHRGKRSPSSTAGGVLTTSQGIAGSLGRRIWQICLWKVKSFQPTGPNGALWTERGGSCSRGQNRTFWTKFAH